MTIRKWIIPAILAVILAATAVVTVTSRNALLSAHRDLQTLEKRYRTLKEKEQTLRVEWVSRTDLNTIERRARSELGMLPPRTDQWRVVTP
ncbi:MAG: cell division protein FtsL [Magnetococcales bacterium]|nr:cell division protein FtsL [Magnetococcales bacterium]